MDTKPKHIGRNITRLRELRGMKQSALADAMGVSQQTISNIENSSELDDSKLNEVAKALEVTAEAIKSFTEESVINYFNTFAEGSVNQGPIGSHNICNFNPLDKLMEAVEENKKLYQQLIEAEKEKVVYLERLLQK